MNIEVYPDGRLVLGGKTYKCAVGKAGVKDEKQEGDNVTPAGCYALRKIYYRADKIDKPKSGLPMHEIKKDDGWCDDPSSPSYNQLIKLPSKYHHEKLWRDDNLYDIVVPLGYNDDPAIPGKGSAIFMHLPRKGYTSTEGCVVLSLPDLLEILEGIESDTQICIHPD